MITMLLTEDAMVTLLAGMLQDKQVILKNTETGFIERMVVSDGIRWINMRKAYFLQISPSNDWKLVVKRTETENGEMISCYGRKMTLGLMAKQILEAIEEDDRLYP